LQDASQHFRQKDKNELNIEFAVIAIANVKLVVGGQQQTLVHRLRIVFHIAPFWAAI
jgi:hypothetical protein